MSFVQVPPDSTGKKVYAVSHSIDGGTVYTQTVHVADYVSASYLQHVNQFGAASVGFSEGQPTLTAFGNLRVGHPSIIGGYEFTHGDMADLFYDELKVGGTVTYQPSSSTMLISTDTTSGSYAERTSNRYHYYQPGVGTLILHSLILSDAGRNNNYRQWGYNDDNNGVFFELNGTTLYAVIRSDATGNVAETRVSQSLWNGDQLNGNGASTLTLDVAKINLYWIDFAWLGSGRVRIGVIGSNGDRIVGHTFENGNNLILPWASTPTLPVCWKNVNTDTTGGSSDLRAICSAVYSESDTQYTFWRFGDLESPMVPCTGSVPLLSVRSKITYEGKTNRINGYPEHISVYTTAPAKIAMVWDAGLTGSVWDVPSDGMLEADVSASSYALAASTNTTQQWYVDTGVTTIDLTPYFETNDEGILLSADDVTQSPLSFVATPLTGTATASLALSYRELR